MGELRVAGRDSRGSHRNTKHNAGGDRVERRDYEEKRKEYHRLGVREYVILDRFEHRVTVLEWKKDGYTERVLGPEESYTTGLLPGLSIPLSTIIE